jgi:RNA-binding protein 23/39
VTPEEAERTVFVKGFNMRTTEDQLREAFAPYGEIEKLSLIRDIVTKCSKGYAFVQYKSIESAKEAYFVIYCLIYRKPITHR